MGFLGGICVILCQRIPILVRMTALTEFFGESEVSLDVRGRFLLPAHIRKQIPDELKGSFVINRGFEKCVTIFTMDVWKIIQNKVNRLNDFNEDERMFKRLFLNGATIVEPDTADRLLIPKSLMEYAGITKEAVLSPQGSKLELWDKDTYYKYINQNAPSFSSLANKIGNPFQDL